MIRVELRDAAVGRGPAAALPPTSTAYRSGSVTVVVTEGEQRSVVLSLVAAGRMKTDGGTVTPAGLAPRVALVDTPGVAEHPADVRVATVVREELALAGRHGAARELARLGLADWARRPFGALPAADRIRMLAELALLRPGVEALIVTSPERHGGDPLVWFRTLRQLAARGIAVLVVTDAATARALAEVAGPSGSPFSGAYDVPLFESTWS